MRPNHWIVATVSLLRTAVDRHHNQHVAMQLCPLPVRRRCAGSCVLTCAFAAVVLAAALAGCASKAPSTFGGAKPAISNPAALPQRNVTGFGDSLRCMDDLLMKFGTRDIVIALEEIQDKTGRISAGTREMMVSAIADLSRRSRAVRLVAFGSDTTNLVNLLQAARQESLFKVLPQFGLRGAVTQFDADVQAERSGFGISLLPFLSARSVSERFTTAIAFDASVVRTEDFTLVPTATSKNVIVVTRRESGIKEGQATRERREGSSAAISKLGIEFSFAVSAQDALAQSVRSVVELAVVEVVGRLAMAPYWKCIGSDETRPEIQREIEDWFIVLERDGKLVAFVQEHLRTRRHFNGATDGALSPQFVDAVGAVRRTLGLPATDEIDAPMFSALVNDRLAPAPKAVALRQPAAPRGLELSTSADEGGPGQSIALRVSPKVDQFVYCYRQGADGKIVRIFPNRFRSDPMLKAGSSLAVPGNDAFTLTLDDTGDATRFACVGSPIEIYSELPPKLRWGDFEQIGFKSLSELRAAFEETAGGRLFFAERSVTIRRR